MQAAGAWLPLLLLHTSKGQNLTQNCSQDLHNTTCGCLLNGEQNSCSDNRLSPGAIVGITVGLLLLLAGVIVGTVLGILRKRRRDATKLSLRKPSEGNVAPGWQARYGSRSSGQFTAAPTPSAFAAPGPNSPGTLLYENLVLGSQTSRQSPSSCQNRGALQDPDDIYMNYEDSSRPEQAIYDNVDGLTCIPHPRALCPPGAEEEDEYVVPGC